MIHADRFANAERLHSSEGDVTVAEFAVYSQINRSPLSSELDAPHCCFVCAWLIANAHIPVCRGESVMKRIKFKYHPNLYSDEILIHEEGICNCCGKKVSEYIGTAYSPEDTDCICLSCIHDGSAAEKLNAEFVQFAEEVSDPEKRDELFKRTPGYMSWQGENWLACCDDYCAYLGTVGIRELEELGIKDDVLRDYAAQVPSYPLDIVEEYLYKDGDLCGYLFRCLHCGKYRIYVDAN